MYKIYALIFYNNFLVSFPTIIIPSTLFAEQKVIIMELSTSFINIIKPAIRTALISLNKKGDAGQTVLIIWHTRDGSRNCCEKCIFGGCPVSVRGEASGSTALASSCSGGGVRRLRLSPASPAARSSYVFRLPHHASQVSFCSAFRETFCALTFGL